MSSWLRAASLLTAFALTSPALTTWVVRRAALGPEAASLVFDLSCFALSVGLVVAYGAFRSGGTAPERGGIPVHGESGARRAWRSGARALAALGVLALAVRILDPLYDRSEFSLRNLAGPVDLTAFLAGLPFGVAAEELIFRTCQRELRRIASPGAAALSVALAFSLYHFVPGTPIDRHLVETLLAVFAGGVVLAVIFEATGSLALLVVVHLAYDLLAVTQATLNVTGARLAEAALFVAWIGGAAVIAHAARRTPLPLSSPPWREAGRVSIPRVRRAVEWAAAIAFGGGVPLALVWLRTLYGF